MAAILNAIKKKKTPAQITNICLEVLPDITSGGTSDDAKRNAEERLLKRLNQMKAILYGENGGEPNEVKAVELSRALVANDALVQLVMQLEALPFEARKAVAAVFGGVVRRDAEGLLSTHLEGKPELVTHLVEGYARPESALLCGQMLREAARHPPLCALALRPELLRRFMGEFVQEASFDVASDAFATLRDLLTRHKDVAAAFLTAHYAEVFGLYNDRLLTSENYVTRRQSLKLLGELLLERANFNVMMQYISDKSNLKRVMIMMRDNSANIQFEAFHVFKVFVANPRKPAEVEAILLNNRDKLVAFLENFHNDKEDPQFIEEKQLLIATLKGLGVEGGGAEGA
ncbi:unnamed protein product, partial [Heterosigma akashiwo]